MPQRKVFESLGLSALAVWSLVMDANELEAQKQGMKILSGYALIPSMKKKGEDNSDKIADLTRLAEEMVRDIDQIKQTVDKVKPLLPDLERRKAFFEGLDKAKNYALGALIFYAFFGEDVSKVIIAKLLGVS